MRRVVGDNKIITNVLGNKQVWNTRKEAEKHFYKMLHRTDGIEREKYTNVYNKIKLGLDICDDTCWR